MWNFIEKQIFAMKWLSDLIEKLLKVINIDTTSRMGGAIHFFFYDVIKIHILLIVLIFTISYIQSYFPVERSRKILGRYKGLGARIIGALLGTVTPFCSCSSIPIFIGFVRAGLSLGTTFSFLISSPMVDLGSLVLLMSIFGAKVAIIYVIFGLLVAIIGGTIIEKMHMESDIAEFITKKGNAVSEEKEMIFLDRILYSNSQVASTLGKVFPYIIGGVFIGALIHNFIPENIIINILGENNPFGVIIATICGVPMYADIFGTIPIAEVLLKKGALLGVVLSFMMAVTTLSLPSLIMLNRVVKKRLFILFISICIVGIIAVGYLFNIIQTILIY